MQRRTTSSTDDADRSEQLSLLPQRAVVSKPVSLDHIPLLKNTSKAIEYACNLADLDPKQIYSDMGLDKTAWSRIANGEREPRFGEVWRFNRLVGNRALTYYFNLIDGWDLSYMRLRVDDSARRIRHLEGELARRDEAIQLLVDAAHGRLTSKQPDDRDRRIEELEQQLARSRGETWRHGGTRP